jgi:hypothetical protein
MYTNVNLAAPVGALAFLGTVALVFALGCLLIFALVTRRRRLTRFAFIALVIVGVGYLGLLLVFSFTSSEKVLAQGQEKHFCEIDCHLAYSVTDEKETKTLNEPPKEITANGTFRIITIKTRFDETTINPKRGNALLYPNSRVVTVCDDQGHEYFPASQAQALLESKHESGSPMTMPLRPGETYLTTLVFDLPANVSHPTLFIREGELVTHFIIGHENSLFHKKTRFQI